VPLALDPDRVRQAWPHTFVFESELDSTNTSALDYCRRGTPLPLLVVAERQRAGRGRSGANWWSGPGSLTFSVALDVRGLGIARGLIPLAAGCAVAQAIEAEARDRRLAQLKWPNDVLLNDRKVAGILVEALAVPAPAAVIGIGVNLNVPAAGVPVELAERAAWVDGWVGHQLDVTGFLLRLLERLLSLSGDSTEDWLQSHYRPRCCLTGRRVRAISGAGPIEGECIGIDRLGRLLVRPEGGPVVPLHSARLERLD
jgi:BirA family biotin operon repressor/biotin-[acetyl-CoA-carboxylase] ligase